MLWGVRLFVKSADINAILINDGGALICLTTYKVIKRAFMQQRREWFEQL